MFSEILFFINTLDYKVLTPYTVSMGPKETLEDLLFLEKGTSQPLIIKLLAVHNKQIILKYCSSLRDCSVDPARIPTHKHIVAKYGQMHQKSLLIFDSDNHSF